MWVNNTVFMLFSSRLCHTRVCMYFWFTKTLLRWMLFHLGPQKSRSNETSMEQKLNREHTAHLTKFQKLTEIIPPDERHSYSFWQYAWYFLDIIMQIPIYPSIQSWLCMYTTTADYSTSLNSLQEAHFLLKHHFLFFFQVHYYVLEY